MRGLVINDLTHLYAYKGLDGQFTKKKGLNGRPPKKVFVVRDKAPYFCEASGFNLPSLLLIVAQLALKAPTIPNSK